MKWGWRYCSNLLVAILFMLLLFSCQRGSEENPLTDRPDETRSQSSTDPQLAQEPGDVYDWQADEWLTDIFTAEKVDASVICSVVPAVLPCYDASEGTFAFLVDLSRSGHYVDGDMRYSTVTFMPTDGTVKAEVPLTMPDMYIASGCVGKEAVYLLLRDYDNIDDYSVRVENRSDGTVAVIPNLISLCSDRTGSIIKFLTADADGHIYLVANAQGESELIVLDPSGSVLDRQYIRASTKSICAANDGVYLLVNTLMRYDLTNKTLEEIPLGAFLDSGITKLLPNSAGELCVSASRGIYVISPDGEGGLLTRRLMDYPNSGVFDETLTLFAIGDDSTVLSVETHANKPFDVLLNIWRRGENIRVSDLNVLEIATARELGTTGIQKLTVDFNKAHPELYVRLTDYSVYNTEDEPNHGSERLAMDLVTGRYHPDVVIGAADGIDIRQIIEKNLFADLDPYLRTDSLVSYDNLFGCVKNLMSTGNGRIWGITDRVSLHTLAANTEMLDAYRSHSSWTLAEFLVFASGLPDDVALMNALNQENYSDAILAADGIGTFLDRKNASCSFGSPLFTSFLRLIEKQPKTREEMWESSPIYKNNGTGKYEAYRSGKAALWQFHITQIMDFADAEITFGTKEYSMIGYPTEGTSGTVVKANLAYVLLNSSEKKDIGWAYIRALFENADYAFSLPTMKTAFEEQVALESQKTIVFTFDNNGRSHISDKDAPSSLKQPGMIVKLSEDDFDHLRSLMETSGAPLETEIPSAIADILHEEISAFLVGHTSPEDCSRYIQSRVSLWLAEHR